MQMRKLRIAELDLCGCGVRQGLGAGGPRGESRTPNGSTLLKRKQLRQLGYTVVPVPFWEWDALEGEKEQEGFLRRKFGESE